MGESDQRYACRTGEGAVGQLCLLRTQCGFLGNDAEWFVRFDDLDWVERASHGVRVVCDSQAVLFVGLDDQARVYRELVGSWVRSGAFEGSRLVRQGEVVVLVGLLSTRKRCWLGLNRSAFALCCGRGEQSVVEQLVEARAVYDVGMEAKGDLFEVTIHARPASLRFYVHHREEAESWCEVARASRRAVRLHNITFAVLVLEDNALRRRTLRIDLCAREVHVASSLPSLLHPTIPFDHIQSCTHGACLSLEVGLRNPDTEECSTLVVYAATERERARVGQCLNLVATQGHSRHPLPALLSAFAPVRTGSASLREGTQWFSKHLELHRRGLLKIFSSLNTSQPQHDLDTTRACVIVLEHAQCSCLCFFFGHAGGSNVLLGFPTTQSRDDWYAAITAERPSLPPRHHTARTALEEPAVLHAFLAHKSARPDSPVESLELDEHDAEWREGDDREESDPNDDCTTESGAEQSDRGEEDDVVGVEALGANGGNDDIAEDDGSDGGDGSDGSERQAVI